MVLLHVAMTMVLAKSTTVMTLWKSKEVCRICHAEAWPASSDVLPTSSDTFAGARARVRAWARATVNTTIR